MKPNSKIRLLLVDDHFIVRMGLAGSLNQEVDMEVVAEADTGEGAVAAFSKQLPDVTLMDGRLPDFHGSVAVAKIRENHPDAKIILISIDETEEDIHRAVTAGARCYLPKSVARVELLNAIRRVAAGEAYFPPAVAARIAARKDRSELTARELDVLRLVAMGRANKQIADELGIAEITAKVHVSRILEKLGAPDRTRAVTLAMELGLVHSGPKV